MTIGKKGLFFFDESFRPVPLHKKYIGIKKVNITALKRNPELKHVYKKLKGQITQRDLMDKTAYDICVESLK